MAPAHIPAILFGVLITTFGYGIAFTLFVISIDTVMRKRKSTGKMNLPFVLPSAMIFIFATLNIMGLWLNTYRAFIVHADNTAAYLNLIRSPAKTIVQTGQLGAIILADAVIVYRTFIVLGSNFYVIIIPCLTFVATFTSGASFVSLQHKTPVMASIFEKNVTEWTVAFLLSSFATTVYCTGLITYKLLKPHLELRRHCVVTSSPTLQVTRILVESAALYSLNHLLYAVLYEVKDQVESSFSYLEASIASITCSLIIIRCEKAAKVLPMTITSAPVGQLAFGDHLQSQDTKLFTLSSMGGVSTNEDV